MRFGFILLGFVATQVWALDPLSCLQAKGQFISCAKRSTAEKFPVRDCLSADSGYEDCRKRNGEGWHLRCLPARTEYSACMDLPGMNHNLCIFADTGFSDCIKWERNPLNCLMANGGYDECRKRNPFLKNNDCLNAQGGYGQCRSTGGMHIICMKAGRSFQYCNEKDRFAPLLCADMGPGYKECREAGFTMAHCRFADMGFADCVSYKERRSDESLE